MVIHGLQKMTLLDFPGKVACTVFLGGCDIRCPFCHNAEILDASVPGEMDDAQFFAFLKGREGLLDGVAITGGEPLLRRELPEFMAKIRELGFAVKLDTNGSHPDRLRKILDEKLADYVAMDIKNSPERYAETIGISGFDITPVKESVSLLKEESTAYEFRTTCVAQLHDDASFQSIAEWITGAKNYFLQAFTDRDTVPFEGLSAPDAADMHRWAEIVRPYVKHVALRGVLT